MTGAGFEDSLCEGCGQPLFLSKEECKSFILSKMEEGFMVCVCCGSKEKVGSQDKDAKE